MNGNHCENPIFSPWPGRNQPETRDGVGPSTDMKNYRYLVPYDHVVINYHKTFPLRARTQIYSQSCR